MKSEVLRKDRVPPDLSFGSFLYRDRRDKGYNSEEKMVLLDNIIDHKRMEQILHESAEKVRALLNEVSDMTFLVDKNGIILNINKAGVDVIGKSVDEIVGTHAYAYFKPDLAKSLKASVDKVFQTSQPFRNEEEDGGVILNQNIYPMFDKTGEVKGAVVSLQDITEKRQIEGELRELKNQLAIKTVDLKEANTALKVLLEKREKDKRELEEKVLFRVWTLTFPYLEKLKKSRITQKQKRYLNIIESHLNSIVDPLITVESSKFIKFTPTEIHVISLVKQGRSTKEIAEILCLATSTINSHRDSIRKKFGIKNRKIGLRSYLASI